MIREGRSFTESLEQAGWMPPLAIDMIGIGERSGSLRWRCFTMRSRKCVSNS
jgi:type IV pilus assembly protein PilC